MSTLCRHRNYDVEVPRLGTCRNKNCKVKKTLTSSENVNIDVGCRHDVDIIFGCLHRISDVNIQIWMSSSIFTMLDVRKVAQRAAVDIQIWMSTLCYPTTPRSECARKQSVYMACD